MGVEGASPQPTRVFTVHRGPPSRPVPTISRPLSVPLSQPRALADALPSPVLPGPPQKQAGDMEMYTALQCPASPSLGFGPVPSSSSRAAGYKHASASPSRHSRFSQEDIERRYRQSFPRPYRMREVLGFRVWGLGFRSRGGFVHHSSPRRDYHQSFRNGVVFIKHAQAFPRVPPPVFQLLNFTSSALAARRWADLERRKAAAGAGSPSPSPSKEAAPPLLRPALHNVSASRAHVNVMAAPPVYSEVVSIVQTQVEHRPHRSPLRP